MATDIEKFAEAVELIEQGIDFDTATDLVKEAGLEGRVAGGMLGTVPILGAAAGVVNSLEKSKRLQRGQASKVMHAIGQGVASSAPIFGIFSGAKLGNRLQNERSEVEQEKKAALNSLIEQGIDFDTATDLVKEAGFMEVFNASRKMGGLKPLTGREAALRASVIAGSAVGGGLLSQKEFNKGNNKSGVAMLALGLSPAIAFNIADSLHPKEQEKKASRSFVEYVNAHREVKGLKPLTGAQIALRAGIAIPAAAIGGYAGGTHLANGRYGAALGSLALSMVPATAFNIADRLPQEEQEKKAALNSLIEQGIDFDTATDLIKEASDGINIKPSHKGELHSELGVPAGQKIPLSALQKADRSSDPAERKRAQFALNARNWNHKKAAVQELTESGVDIESAVQFAEDTF